MLRPTALSHARAAAAAASRDEASLDEAPSDERRRSFEAPDVIEVQARVAGEASSTPPPPPPGADAAAWSAWNEALAAAGGAEEAAAMDAAADAIAEQELRRTQQAVGSVLLAVVGGGGDAGAQLTPPEEGRGRQLLLWAWARKRARALRSLASAARWLAAGLLLATGAAQAWGRPALNEKLLPWVASSASAACGRPLRLGRVRWLLPTGLTGLTPLATLGPCSLGPCRAGAGVERSSCELQGASLYLHPLASLARGRPVLRAALWAPTAHVVQADNCSWLGYPDDTLPVSSRPVGAATPGGAAALAAAAPEAAAAARPAAELAAVSVEDGTLLLHVAADGPGAPPRRVSGLSGALLLSPDMRALSLDLSGRAAQRETPPGGPRVSMLLSEKRHLRTKQTGAERAAEAAEAARGGAGGALRVRVRCSGIATPGRWPELEVRVAGQNLHGPVLENLLDIPMDMLAGRLDGEIVIRCCDADSWDFPLLSGRFRGAGLRFHFVDAPDDFAGVDAEFLFDGRKLYLHDARGFYGAIPLSCTGDIDLTPTRGEYHLSAAVPGCEMNDLRETLGGRPAPKPLAGSLAGSVHITGPLEKPVFMGTVQARASAAGLAASLARAPPGSGPAAWAAEALAATPRAVAAYDRIAFEAVKAVWTLDTASGLFVLHEAEAIPAGGGAVRAAGQLRVDPAAEAAPDGIRFTVTGEGVDGARLARAYQGALREGAGGGPPPPELPPQLLEGLRGASFSALLAGSQLTPGCSVAWSAPGAEAEGSVELQRAAITARLRTPSLEASCVLETAYPPLAQALAAATQEEAMAAADFTVTGAEGELAMNNADVLQLLPADAGAESKPDRLRLRLSGKARFSGRREGGADADAPAAYRGDLQLSQLRLNQLMLAPSFGGSFSASPAQLSVDARGRPDESLRLELGPGPAGPGLQLQLRRGALRLDAQAADGVGALEVAGVRLDDLELGSLRGRLERAELRADWGAQQGSASLLLSAPRFSGLQGESLAAEGAWADGALRLQSGVLQQQRSRYQLQAEYALPGSPAAGSWSAALAVPEAEAEEALPAVRLLRALRRGGGMRADYARARAAFLHAMRTSGVSADTLAAQLEAAVRGAAAKGGAPAATLAGGPPPAAAAAAAAAVSADAAPARAAGGGAAGHLEELPGLQEVRGSWRGTVSARGGAPSADAPPSLDVQFDLQGSRWQWGPHYGCEALAARGAFGSADGLQLEELSARSGATQLTAHGALLGRRQAASFRLDDFPAPLLQTLARTLRGAGAGAGAGGGAGAGAGAAAPRRAAAAEALAPAGRAGLAAAEAGAGAAGGDFLTGSLYASGELGGSAAQPEAKVQLRLVDGAVRATRLAVAEASASLSAAQRLGFHLSVAPAAGEGHLRVEGSCALRLGSVGPEAPDPGPSSEEELVVDAVCKDSGMLLLAALAPRGALDWRGGAADVALRVRGSLQRPLVDGLATVVKATLAVPDLLARPLTGLSGAVRVAGEQLSVEGLEARLGRRGHLRVRGALPLRPPPAPARGAQAAAAWAAHLLAGGGEAAAQGIRVDVTAAELRADKRFSGLLDAQLAVRGAVMAPEVSGELQFSRGIAQLGAELSPQPPAAAAAGAGAADADAAAAAEAEAAEAAAGAGGGRMAVQRAGGAAPPAPEQPPAEGEAERPPPPAAAAGGISGFFRNAAARAEQARRAAALAAAASAPPAPRATAPAAAAPPAGGPQPGPGLSFRGLRVRLGPELRVVYPLLLNFGLSGELELSGRASLEPGALRPSGCVSLTNGEVNLLATQARLNREHANRVVFDPEHALDPMLDVCLTSADLRVLVQGRASGWQRGMTITRPGAPGGEGAALTPSEAARVFEGQLAGSLLQDDGQLALSNLAASTIATLLPKIETQGQLGSARWRLVSAPSIPGLLSLDPSKGLAGLTLGTEVEVQFGPSFSASVTRKLNDSDMETQFSAIYQLSSKLRVQLNAVSSAVTRLLFQFTA